MPPDPLVTYHARASAILEQDELMSTSVQSSFSPLTYSAPMHRGTCVPEHFNDEDEDEGYTKVKLEGGQVEIEGYTDDMERAPLPLLSTSTSARSSLILLRTAVPSSTLGLPAVVVGVVSGR